MPSSLDRHNAGLTRPQKLPSAAGSEVAQGFDGVRLGGPRRRPGKVGIMLFSAEESANLESGPGLLTKTLLYPCGP